MIEESVLSFHQSFYSKMEQSQTQGASVEGTLQSKQCFALGYFPLEFYFFFGCSDLGGNTLLNSLNGRKMVCH